MQTAAGMVGTQNTALATAQSAATTALSSASANLTTANTDLTTANTQNAAIITAQAATAAQVTAAQTAAGNAQAAALAAQTAAAQAATLQAAGDLAGADAQLLIAQQQLAIAQLEQTAALAAQTAAANQLVAAQAAATAASTAVTAAEQAAIVAATDAATASTQAATAQTAASSATAALAETDPAVVSPTPSAANAVQTNSATIVANASVAAYNNPAVVGSFIPVVMFPVTTAGGFNEAFAPTNPLQPNTMYVLDGNYNLIEMRNAPFQVQANQNGTVLTPSITGASGADIKWSGGTAADTFKLTDNSIYGGRWMGATVTVTDNATPANVYTYTPAASLWSVILPPSPGYVTSLVGSVTYAKVGNTTPVDAFGNLGTLNSATLTANFTSQLVDATVNLALSTGSMTGTFNISGTAMPIDPNGGFAVPNAGALATSCAGACAAGVAGYSADLGGSFAGTGAASAGMSYNVWPTVAAGSPASNSLQGLVAFSVATAPGAGTNPAVGNWESFSHLAVGGAGAWQRGRFNMGVLPAQPNTSFILDGAGNLVSSLHVNYNERATWQSGPATNAFSDAAVTYSGGIASDRYTTPDGSLTIGRWTGGQLIIADNLSASTLVKNLGVTSAYWALGSASALTAGYVQTLVGTTTYTQGGATLPTDTFGNVGTPPVATLAANFTNQTIDASVAFSIATQDLTVSATGVPIQVGPPSFFDATLELGTAPTVGCTGAGCSGGGYLGWLSGSFNGAAAKSADVAYKIWPTAAQGASVTDIIQGIVAFYTATAPSAGANPAAPPAGYYLTGFGQGAAEFSAGQWLRTRINDNGLQPNTSFVLDGSGNLVKMLHANYREQPVWRVAAGPQAAYNDATVIYSGGTANDYFQLPDGSITLGRWQGGTMTITDNLAVLPALVKNLGAASMSWDLVLPTPANYVQSLVGTTTYTLAGATSPTDSAGNVGTLTNASLTANFTNQTVDTAIALSIANQNLTLSATAVPLVAGTNFFDAMLELGTAPTVACAGAGCSGAGYLGRMGVVLAGTAAASAESGYMIWPTATVDSTVSNIIRGVIAFSTATAPTVNPAGPLVAYAATNTAVAYTGAYGGSFTFIAAPGEVIPPNNPTTFTDNYGGSWGYRIDVLNGATTATVPTTTANGITFGVWDTVTSVSASEQHLLAPSQNSGSKASHSYMYGAEGYLDSAVVAGVSTGLLSGTFTYNPVAAVSYDTGTWATGSVTATMSANFTSQTVSVGLAGTMGATSWTSTGTNMPINFMNLTTGTGASFKNVTPTITVNTIACPTCGGNINGAFVGQNYAGAIVQYSLWDFNNLNVDGLVAFENTTPVGTGGTPTGAYVMANNSFNVERPTTITSGAGGVLTGWSVGSNSSTVAPAAGSVAQAAVGTGSGTINWGQWGAGSIFTNVFNYIPGAAQLHWITAPEPTPVYLAEVLTATNAVYSFVGGDVTSLSGGVHGAITGGSTSLTANFTTQTVAVNLALVVNGHSWLASTPNAPLQYSNGNTLNTFYADSGRGAGQPGYLTVTVDGAAAYGNLAGQLVGAALDGAILKFNLDGQAATGGYEFVQGVTALQAAVANDPATAYRMIATSMSEPSTPVPTVVLGGAYNNAARVLTDVNGLTQFDDNSGGNGSTIQYVSGTYADQGSVVVGGDTVSWGRWGAGTVVNVQDRATGTWQNGIVLAGGAHAIVGPLMSGPVSLPTTGTYVYTKIGNTLPTDQAGVAGTLNSATLSANFTAQTVNLGVNVTAGGATLDAAAVNVPILQRSNFYTDSRMTGVGALAVTCAGTCGTTNHGAIGGGFAGAGGAVAGISYGFEKGGVNAGTVSGVAVFQR